jgi:hypothetical protein
MISILFQEYQLGILLSLLMNRSLKSKLTKVEFRLKMGRFLTTTMENNLLFVNKKFKKPKALIKSTKKEKMEKRTKPEEIISRLNLLILGRLKVKIGFPLLI